MSWLCISNFPRDHLIGTLIQLWKQVNNRFYHVRPHPTYAHVFYDDDDGQESISQLSPTEEEMVSIAILSNVSVIDLLNLGNKEDELAALLRMSHIHSLT